MVFRLKGGIGQTIAVCRVLWNRSPGHKSTVELLMSLATPASFDTLAALLPQSRKSRPMPV